MHLRKNIHVLHSEGETSREARHTSGGNPKTRTYYIVRERTGDEPVTLVTAWGLSRILAKTYTYYTVRGAYSSRHTPARVHIVTLLTMELALPACFRIVKTEVGLNLKNLMYYIVGAEDEP